MHKIKLSKTQLKKLEQLMGNENNIRIQRRLQAIQMANQGLNYKQIAATLHVTDDTITDWIKLYEAKKLSGLCKLQFTGKRKSKINAYVDQIKQDVKDNAISTLAQMQALIKRKYAIEMEQSWLFRCCKKNSIYLTRKPA
jgi:transposase